MVTTRLFRLCDSFQIMFFDMRTDITCAALKIMGSGELLCGSLRQKPLTFTSLTDPEAVAAWVLSLHSQSWDTLLASIPSPHNALSRAALAEALDQGKGGSIDPTQAAQLYSEVSVDELEQWTSSGSPLLRALSRYHLGRMMLFEKGPFEPASMNTQHSDVLVRGFGLVKAATDQEQFLDPVILLGICYLVSPLRPTAFRMTHFLSFRNSRKEEGSSRTWWKLWSASIGVRMLLTPLLNFNSASAMTYDVYSQCRLQSS